MILATRQDDTFRVARSTTGIKDVSDIVHAGRSLNSIHLRLTGEVLTHLQEVIEVHDVGIMRRNLHVLIKDNDALQRLTSREHTTCLLILILFTHEEESHPCIVQHELDLLLTAGSIERDSHSPDAPCAKVAEQVLHRVL